jgi:AmpE protein
MIFLSLIAVLAILYKSNNLAVVLQRDAWFVGLLKHLRTLFAGAPVPLLPMFVAFALPILVIVLSIWAIGHFLSTNFLFFLYVPVLLYSLGRGDFLVEINQYIALAGRDDFAGARQWVEQHAGQAGFDSSQSPACDWQSLHTLALKVIGYRGFERTFAVLFWFVTAGALGALLYRLSVICREQAAPGSAEALWAEKWLWLIEFPAVRLMGLTWAFVGSFDSGTLRASLLDFEQSSRRVLNNSLRGALGAPSHWSIDQAAEVGNVAPADTSGAQQQEQEDTAREVMEDLVGITLSPQAEPAYSFALVKSSVPLYSRSLLFWVGAIAFATLFI